MLRKTLFNTRLVQEVRKMSVFIQKLNPITGVNDWIVQNEDYDYYQEVARSAFADMLHDTERNQLYEKALKAAIEKMHSRGKKANVLDIGTGTGLLSMMAARNGADSITACEAFKPMSECAKKIVELNGFKDKIKIIPKRSTNLTVGPDCDLPERCNILVTEVFDTELIGEGALSTYNHAHKCLLEEDCIVVPQSATIYAQIVECPLIQNWNKCKNIYNDDGKLLLSVPEKVTSCPGSTAVHDLQLSQIPSNLINTIVSPIPVLRFDWSGKTPFVYERSTINNVKAENSGTAQAVFIWWDLEMDTENKIILSCAPKWAHPLTKSNPTAKIPWRDHWMQAVYYFPKEITVNKGEEINLISCHDEYSLWFNLSKDLRITEMHYLNPICECGLHVAFSRTRIGQINDFKRNKRYLSLLKKYVKKDSEVIILSDGFVFGLVAAKLGAKKIYFIENNYLSSKIVEEYIKYNNLTNVEVVTLDKVEEVDFGNVDVVFSEPYFVSSILPWDNLLFTYILKSLKKYLPDNVKIFPQEAVIKAVAVQFEDLHKIRCPLGKCEDFLMKDFDDLIEASSTISDDNVEAQPLWEYPCIALSNDLDIARLDLLDIPENPTEIKGEFKLLKNSVCNGIALWVEWLHEKSSDTIITTGPTQPIIPGEKIEWDIHTRQGVCLFSNISRDRINYNFKFDYKEGNISFKHN